MQLIFTGNLSKKQTAALSFLATAVMSSRPLLAANRAHLVPVPADCPGLLL